MVIADDPLSGCLLSNTTDAIANGAQMVRQVGACAGSMPNCVSTAE
jgi:hypothetical protein